MAWWDPSSYYAAATTAASSAWSATTGLFTSRDPLVSGGAADQGLGLFEPDSTSDVVQYDPTEPYTNRPGNQGCPPNYYTSYEGGYKVCRRYGYDQNNKLVTTGGVTSPNSWSDSFWLTAGKVSDVAAAPFKALKTNTEGFADWFGNHLGGGLLKGSYAVIGILIAAAVVIIMANRFLSKRGV